MIKVDTKKELLSTNGTQYTNEAGNNLTVADVCIMVLDGRFETDKNEGLKTLKRKFDLISAFLDGKDGDGMVELSADDSSYIQERLPKTVMNTFVLVNVANALEGK